MSNLRNELKRYLIRHEHLHKETEWKEVSIAYGLFKDENSNTKTGQNLVHGINGNHNDLEQDEKLKEHDDEADRN